MNSVLDSSALLAFLLNEPGAAAVRARIFAGAAISAANFAEVVAFFTRQGFPPERTRAILSETSLQLVPLDEPLALDTGLLVKATRPAGLSLGDRACLAVARHLGVPAVTADRAWARVSSEIGVTVDLIR